MVLGLLLKADAATAQAAAGRLPQGELLLDNVRTLAMRENFENLGRLVRFEFPAAAHCENGTGERAMLRRLNQRRKSPDAEPDPGFERELRGRLRQRALELPFPDACLVASPDLLAQWAALAERPPAARPAAAPWEALPVHRWEGDACGQLAVIAQATKFLWQRDCMPQLRRVCVAGRRRDVAVTLLLPAAPDDPHLRPPEAP